MKTPKFESIIRGPVVIVLTPFTDNGSTINEEQLRKNVRFMIDNGMGKEAGMLVCGGSTGDCYVLSLEERKKLFWITCDEARGECPIFCGINSTSTNEAIEMAQYAKSCGAVGVMSTPPFYWTNPNPDIVYSHYKALSDSCSLGIMIYNNPSIVAQDISLEMLTKLAKIENIVALKECSANLIKFKLVVEQLSDQMVIVNGAGEWIEPLGYQLGTSAFISGFANMYPEACLKIHKLANARKYDEADAIISQFKPIKRVLWENVQKFGAPIEAKIYKEMADILGFNEGGTRLPILPISKELRSDIEKAIKEIRL